jgi:hypothetical protein
MPVWRQVQRMASTAAAKATRAAIRIRLWEETSASGEGMDGPAACSVCLLAESSCTIVMSTLSRPRFPGKCPFLLTIAFHPDPWLSLATVLAASGDDRSGYRDTSRCEVARFFLFQCPSNMKATGCLSRCVAFCNYPKFDAPKPHSHHIVAALLPIYEL